MRKEGHDPGNASTDVSTPQGVGNVAAAALIAYRRHDGANQHGDEVGSDGTPYSDWTYYRNVNPADKIFDPDCWKPIAFDDGKGKGGKVTPGFLTPHWYRVKPFALKRSTSRPADTQGRFGRTAKGSGRGTGVQRQPDARTESHGRVHAATAHAPRDSRSLAAFRPGRLAATAMASTGT